MRFILSAIRPPEGETKYGKAVTPGRDPFESVAGATKAVTWVLANRTPGSVVPSVARGIAQEVMESPGREFRHAATGLTFRVDPEGEAPHPCPCCERLVMPDDHAYAGAEDAYCLGCFTWSRDIEACLPENSAHIVEEG